ncbi:hypothetical protein GQ457_03G026030 [Hibiscus cannabinus]
MFVDSCWRFVCGKLRVVFSQTSQSVFFIDSRQCSRGWLVGRQRFFRGMVSLVAMKGDSRCVISSCSPFRFGFFLFEMALIAWNARGLGNKEIIRALKNVAFKFHSNIIFLSETKQKK